MRKVSKKKKVLVRVTGVVGTFLIFMNVNAMPMATVSGDVVNVRTGASMDAEVVAQVQKGQEFEVAGMQDGWYEIKSQEIENLIAEEEDAKRAAQLSADPLTAAATTSTFYVSSDYLELQLSDLSVGGGLNLRLAPTTESRIIKQFYDGDSVKLLYRYDENWLYVEYDGTFRGYVAKEYVDLSSIDDSTLDIVDEINRNRFVAVVKDDCTSLNLRADASTEAESVGSAGPGATLEVLDYQEGAEWIKVKKDDSAAYVNAQYVNLDRALTAEVDEDAGGAAPRARGCGGESATGSKSIHILLVLEIQQFLFKFQFQQFE